MITFFTFTLIQNCRNIFFRGDEADYGFIPLLETGSGFATAVDAKGFTKGSIKAPVDRDPTWEDVLIAYATVPGYVANRCTITINNLTKNLTHENFFFLSSLIYVMDGSLRLQRGD